MQRWNLIAARWSLLPSLVVGCGASSSELNQPGKETGPCVDYECLGDELVCLSDLCVNPNATPESSDEAGPSTATTTADTNDATTDATLTDSVTDSADSTGGPMPGGGRFDVLFVVDNSSNMADEQLELARAAVAWVNRLQTEAPSADLQLMITTTDRGNPLCTVFQPDGYEPADGEPTVTGCNQRIHHFTGLGSNPVVAEYACTMVCPTDVEPSDPFIAFGPQGSNVPDGPEVDVDGDGTPDSPVAQAAACLLPQGINGCGYETPLESMLQALNPDADWNAGERPFLRSDANLAIVILTDEEDCSVEDFSIMNDPSYQEIDPNTGETEPSSAICWNAGIACDGPNGGIYSNCEALDNGNLWSLSRYVGYIVGELVGAQAKRVDFFVIAGVPQVTAYDPDPPFGPTAGGLPDLVVRDWEDGQYPAGDILPSEYAVGIGADDKQFAFGVGPACTGEDPSGVVNRQAVPALRLFGVCQAIDDGGESRCFIDSICNATYDGAFGALFGSVTQ